MSIGAGGHQSKLAQNFLIVKIGWQNPKMLRTTICTISWNDFLEKISITNSFFLPQYLRYIKLISADS